MRLQPIKRGHKKNLEGDGLKRILEEVFGADKVVEVDGRYEVTYGALNPLRTWLEDKGLAVETVMKKDVSDDVAADTIKKYNTFLDKATGYTAKERIKRARKGA
ncbi:MAG: DUF5611 family protein [Thermoplasmata archaeon]|nr:DUF5611 family protein [Thermoplasmata archaeon]